MKRYVVGTVIGLLSLAAGAQQFQGNVFTEAQAAQVITKLEPPKTNTKLVEDWATARDVVSKLITVSACGVGSYPNNPGQNEVDAWEGLGRWIDPDVKNPYSHGFYPLAIWHTKHHPRSSCMNILRVDQWSKPSKNTLAFRVHYVSDQSDETFLVNYTFKRIEADTWLFNSAKY